MPSLCVFGDSVSKGVILDSARQKYTFLKDCFANLFAKNTGVKIDNFSKFGCTVVRGAEIVEKRLSELVLYDYVALEFGGNDCNFNWADISENPDGIHLPQTPIEEFSSCLTKIITRIKSAGGHPILINLPPLDPVKFFSWSSRNLNRENILRWLGDIGKIYRWQGAYSDKICQLAVSAHIPLVDIRTPFLKQKDYRQFICDDGMHPNTRGHFLISQAIQKHYGSILLNN